MCDPSRSLSSTIWISVGQLSQASPFVQFFSNSFLVPTTPLAHFGSSSSDTLLLLLPLLELRPAALPQTTPVHCQVNHSLLSPPSSLLPPLPLSVLSPPLSSLLPTLCSLPLFSLHPPIFIILSLLLWQVFCHALANNSEK